MATKITNVANHLNFEEKTFFVLPLSKEESMFPNIDLGENHDDQSYFKEYKLRSSMQ